MGGHICPVLYSTRLQLRGYIFVLRCFRFLLVARRYSDWLQAGQSGDRIPVGRDFPHFSRPALGPTQPLYNGYRVFPGGKERPGRDADPSPPSSVVGHERVELYLYSPFGPYGLYRASVPVQGCTLPLLLPFLLSI